MEISGDEVATLFTLTEKSIMDIRTFMKTHQYNDLPIDYRAIFVEKLERTQEIHSRLAQEIRRLNDLE